MQTKKIISSIFVVVIVHLVPITQLPNYLFQSNNAYAQQKKSAQQIQNERLLNLARGYEQSGQFERSLELYQRLWRDDPKSVIYYRGVKQNYVRLKQFDLALATVQKMLTNNPTALIEADLGDAYYKLGEKDQAFSIWNGMIQKNPRHRSTYQVVASAMISNRLYDDAIKVYQLARKTLKNNRLFIIEMANIYRARMDYRQAISLYLEYLNINPKQYRFVEQNILSYANDPELVAEIEKILVQKIQQNPGKIELRNLLAAFYMRSANYQSALQEFSLIDEYIVTRPKIEKPKIGSQLYSFAQNAYSDGKFQYAIQAYTLLLSRYPESPYAANAKFGLAKAYEKSGDFNRSMEMYQEIIDRYKKSPLAKQSLFRIGEIKLDQFSAPAEAEGYFQRVLKIPSNAALNYNAMFRIGDCYLRQGLLDRAGNWYQQMVERYGSNDEVEKKALLELGKIAYWKGDFDKALEKFSKIQNEPINVTNRNAGIYVNDALEFAMFIEQNKQNPELLKKFAQADLLLEQKQPQKALEIYYQVVKNSSTDPLSDDAWLKIGSLEYQQGRYQQALTAFQNLIQNQPESVHCDLAQKMIGEIYEEGLKNISKAQEAYEVVLTSYPNSVWLEEVRKRIRLLEKEEVGNKETR